MMERCKAKAFGTDDIDGTEKDLARAKGRIIYIGLRNLRNAPRHGHLDILGIIA